ncbi:MAG: hypothetical protein HYW90_02285 [Candidatus Sungbacteria bacterium]|nr:hypothetical protein [Candidatus Sungbacteria bacterium]
MRNNEHLRKTLGKHRRWFLVFGGVLTLAVTAIFFFVPFSPKENKRYSGPPKTKEEVIELLNRDTDNDGLKDWEEKIYGTDPENADTDGDGTPDGEEIKLSRNPLRPGPGDELSIPLPPPTNGNKTEALANEFIGRSLTQILAESVTGGELPTDLSGVPALNTYTQKLGEERPLDKVIPPETRELALSDDNSPETVKKYFNRIADIYDKNFSPIDSDINILYLAAAGNNPKAFRRLDANVKALENAIAEIKKTTVPSKWTKFAKDDIWYLSKTLAAVKILKNSENDPVSSLLILRDRIQLVEDMKNLYLDTKKNLAAAGIAFEKDELASWLLQ